MPLFQRLDRLTTAYQMTCTPVIDTMRSRGVMRWSSIHGLPRQHVSRAWPGRSAKHRYGHRASRGGHHAWTVVTGGDMFNLSSSFIRESLLHCASQTHLCTRHNVVSAPVKRAIVCGKPFGRKA